MAAVIHGQLQLEEGEGYEEGLVTPLEMCTPEDRASFAEEHKHVLVRVYGMSPAEAAAHIYFAQDLSDG